jgi:hypothetical protein
MTAGRCTSSLASGRWCLWARLPAAPPRMPVGQRAACRALRLYPVVDDSPSAKICLWEERERERENTLKKSKHSSNIAQPSPHPNDHHRTAFSSPSWCHFLPPTSAASSSEAPPPATQGAVGLPPTAPLRLRGRLSCGGAGARMAGQEQGWRME